MAKIHIGGIKVGIQNTAIQTAKVFIYKFDKEQDKTMKQRGYVKEDGVGYTVEVSIKDDEYRIKLFENGERKRIGIISESLTDLEFEQLEKGYELLKAYFTEKPIR